VAACKSFIKRHNYHPFLQSNTTHPLAGPERLPTSEGFKYPNPHNRDQQRYSFRFKDIGPMPKKERPKPEDFLINIIIKQDDAEFRELLQSIQDLIDLLLSENTTQEENAMFARFIQVDHPSIVDQYLEYVHKLSLLQERIGPGSDMTDAVNDPQYLELYERILELKTFFKGKEEILNNNQELQEMIARLGEFGIIIRKPPGMNHIVKMLSIHGGVWSIDESSGELGIVVENLPGVLEMMTYTSEAVWGIIFYNNPDIPINANDIHIDITFGFKVLGPIVDADGNTIILIRRFWVDPWVEWEPVVAR